MTVPQVSQLTMTYEPGGKGKPERDTKLYNYYTDFNAKIQMSNLNYASQWYFCHCQYNLNYLLDIFSTKRILFLHFAINLIQFWPKIQLLWSTTDSSNFDLLNKQNFSTQWDTLWFWAWSTQKKRGLLRTHLQNSCNISAAGHTAGAHLHIE